MKRVLAVALVLLMIVVCVGVGPVEARGGGHGGGGHGGGGHHGGGHGHFHGRGRVFVGVSPFVFGPYWGGAWYPPYAYAPSVVVQEPPVYIQRNPASNGMWYYCPSSRAYYPSVPSCPEPWVPVPAQP